MPCFRKGSLRSAAIGIAALATLGLAACEPIYTREDFQRDVMNKTPAEVEDHLGKPDAVDASDPGKLVWIYDEKTIDTENKNARDPKTRIIFGRQEPAGKQAVAEVRFGS